MRRALRIAKKLMEFAGHYRSLAITYRQSHPLAFTATATLSRHLGIKICTLEGRTAQRSLSTRTHPICCKTVLSRCTHPAPITMEVGMPPVHSAHRREHPQRGCTNSLLPKWRPVGTCTTLMPSRLLPRKLRCRLVETLRRDSR